MRVVLLSFIALFFLPPLTAQAGQILHCGVPERATVNTDPDIGFCDIYTRQLEYRNSRLALRSQLDERAKNYAAPGIQARKNYRANLQALHDSYGNNEDSANSSIDIKDSFK